MNKIYAMSRNQGADNTLYSAMFTMKKSYMNTTDSYENNINFKIFQNSGDKVFIERNYYIAICKGVVIFHGLDYNIIDENLRCVYVDNGDNTITVYAKGNRADTSICLEINQCPLIGKIQFHNKKEWVSLTDKTVVEATEIQQVYHFTPLEWNNNFFINSTNANKYREYTATKQEVRLCATLTVNSKTFTGEDKLFKINANYVPLWAFPDTKTEYIRFHQEYGYNKDNTRVYGKCTLQIYKDGTVKVSGMPSLVDGSISTLDLYLDVNYKRI
jgi:hypothetical protein